MFESVEAAGAGASCPDPVGLGVPGGSVPSGVVGDLLVAVQRAVGLDVAGVGLAELRANVAVLLTVQSQLAGLVGRVVAAGEQRGVAQAVGMSSTAGWLRSAFRLDPVVASRWVRLGRGLAVRPAVAPGLDAGEIEVEHARVLLRAVEQARVVRPDLAESELTDGEALLLDVARVHTPGMLRAVAVR